MNFVSDKKTFCIITGASRGLGCAIAESLAIVCGANSTFVLIARNEINLTFVCNKLTNNLAQLKAVPIALDISKCDFAKFDSILQPYAQGDYEQAVLIHNAATTGSIDKRACELTDTKELQDYFQMNFNSMVLLNSAFMKNFTEQTVSNRIIVNISSGAAYNGLKGLHVYAAGKAARDSFLRIFALEEPSVRVLSFNPGALDTDMQRESEKSYWAEDVRKWSHDGLESGTFSTPKKAAEILLNILNRNDYESGSFLNMRERVLQFKSISRTD